MPGHSLPLLAKLLENRTSRLQGQLQRMHSQTMNISDTNILDCLFEDIHWLVLIAGMCSAYAGSTRRGIQWSMEPAHSCFAACCTACSSTLTWDYMQYSRHQSLRCEQWWHPTCSTQFSVEICQYKLSDFSSKSDVWLTVHRNSVWIRKTN